MNHHSLALLIALLAPLLMPRPGTAEALPLVDAHIHYSHDAWARLPPEQAVAILREAGLKQAFVSSSSDQGTQMLYAMAPELIVPVLRPYRARGETSSWIDDDTVPAMLAELLSKNTYAGIGEFHVFGADVDKPVVKQVIELARRHRIFLHAHSDAGAVNRIFALDPDARVLWAHSGFDQPGEVAQMLDAHPNLWADLAFRSEHGANGKVDAGWRAVFDAYPTRFVIGTDTYTPERWYFVVEHASWSRAWLADLPVDLRENIAWRNAEALARWALAK